MTNNHFGKPQWPFDRPPAPTWKNDPFGLEARRAVAPPLLAKPTLITKDGELVAIAEEFTVTLSPSDPNWRPNIPGWCFRRPKEDYGKSLVRRIAARRAAEKGTRNDKA